MSITTNGVIRKSLILNNNETAQMISKKKLSCKAPHSSPGTTEKPGARHRNGVDKASCKGSPYSIIRVLYAGSATAPERNY
jgi:hypothetical protein